MRGSGCFTVVALLAGFALAGCTTGDGSEGDGNSAGTSLPSVTTTPSLDGPDNSSVAPVPALVHLDCRQYHSFFAFPQSLLEGVQPEGFTLQPSMVGPGLTDVYAHWEFCAAGNATLSSTVDLGAVSHFYAAVQVAPPATLALPVADEPLLDLYPIAWLAPEPVVAWLAAHNATNVHPGLVALQGSVPAGGVVADALDASTSWGAFHSDTAVQVGGADFPASLYRMWTAVDGVANGFLEMRMTDAPTVGSGTVGMSFHGDPLYGPPPYSHGLVHVVEGIGVTTTFVALE